jgi:hypothetical protein
LKLAGISIAEFMENDMNSSNTPGRSMLAGLAGSVVLTGIHETLRKTTPEAPRMDLLGMQSLSKLLKVIGLPIPGQPALFGWTLLGDVGGNALYYSLAARGSAKSVWVKGISLGLIAGIAAVILPAHVGLDNKASARTTNTAVKTIAIYLAGGIATAAVAWALSSRNMPLEIKTSKVHTA